MSAHRQRIDNVACREIVHQIVNRKRARASARALFLFSATSGLSGQSWEIDHTYAAIAAICSSLI
jgi:hypothetical protein